MGPPSVFAHGTCFFACTEFGTRLVDFDALGDGQRGLAGIFFIDVASATVRRCGVASPCSTLCSSVRKLTVWWVGYQPNSLARPP